MEIKVPGGSFDSRELPKPIQRKLLRKRVQLVVMPWVKMAGVALVVDLILRAVL